jgi:hypothetical protein
LESALFLLGKLVQNCTQIFFKENILLNFFENFATKEFARFTQVSSVNQVFQPGYFESFAITCQHQC